MVRAVEFDADLIKRYEGSGPRYTSYPTAMEFSPAVREQDYAAWVQRSNATRRPLSLYVHIPFCAHVCFYCACNKVVTGDRSKAQPYLAALAREIRLQAALVDMSRPVEQLHWGGGTPTFLSEAEIRQLMRMLGEHFQLLEDGSGEYSIEVDPREVREATLPTLREIGFNRMSLGLQDLVLAIVRDAPGGRKLQIESKEPHQVNEEGVDGAHLEGVEPAEHYPRATDYIPQMVELVKKLEASGHAYRSEGSIYYSIETFPEYGKLSGVRPEQNLAGARVDNEEYEKEDARDFVLWKGSREDEPSWDTEIGPGRPGWHLECSAMSIELLGEEFDIHTGGVDNIFPHHENEIAQSEGASGEPFVRYWMHAAHLMVDAEKMAKSKGNFYTLRDLLEKGHDRLAIRYMLI